MNKYTIALLIAISIALSLPQTVKANFGFNIYSYPSYGMGNYRSNNCYCGYANYNTSPYFGQNIGQGNYQNYYSPMVGGYYMSPYQSYSRNVLDAVVFDRLARSSQVPAYSVRYNTDNRSNYNNRNLNNYQSYNAPTTSSWSGSYRAYEPSYNLAGDYNQYTVKPVTTNLMGSYDSYTPSTPTNLGPNNFSSTYDGYDYPSAGNYDSYIR